MGRIAMILTMPVAVISSVILLVLLADPIGNLIVLAWRGLEKL